MYDFYFGSKNDIKKDPKTFLLTIKRMLPRWCNSIPDSEYLAIYDMLAGFKFPPKPVLVETGSGASTIVLAYFALKTGGELYTWDINGNKLAYLRGVLNDTVMRYFTDKNLSKHWKHIAFDSNSVHAGIGMLKELKKTISAAFFDSEHTFDVLKKELHAVSELIGKQALIAIDDGNYAYRHHNTAYINMLRKKLGLGPISETPGNVGRPFWIEAGDYLKDRFKTVRHISDTYKKNYAKDIFWSYYRNDRNTMAGLDMEKTDDLEHRFDAWMIKN